MRVHKNWIQEIIERNWGVYIQYTFPARYFPKKGEIYTETPSDYVEFPPEWIMFVNCKRLAKGQESGRAYLSRLGFQEKEAEIKKAFLKLKNGVKRWADFREETMRFYTRVDIESQKFLNIQRRYLRKYELLLEEKMSL